MLTANASIAIVSKEYPAAYWQAIFKNIPFALFTQITTLTDEFSGLILADEISDNVLPESIAGQKRVMVASTCYRLNELTNAPFGTVRTCGWSGFWEHDLWEMAGGKRDDTLFWENLLATIGKKPLWVPDTTGLIAPAVIARLVNEAWYVWKDGISDPASIDLAMQLGTNYPLGPLAWGEKIGLSRIAELLQKLEREMADAEPHPELLQHLPKTK